MPAPRTDSPAVRAANLARDEVRLELVLAVRSTLAERWGPRERLEDALDALADLVRREEEADAALSRAVLHTIAPAEGE